MSIRRRGPRASASTSRSAMLASSSRRCVMRETGPHTPRSSGYIESMRIRGGGAFRRYLGGVPEILPSGRRAAEDQLRLLERLEVAVDLPGAHLHPVLVPLLLLCLHEALEDVIAEGIADHRVAAQLVDRLAQGSRQLLDLAGFELRGVEVVEVLFHRVWRRELPLDAVEAGGEHGRECQVGVRGGIGAAQLDAHRVELALAARRDADEG